VAATHITSTNVSGPPGTGVAWTNNVRGIKWSGLMLLQGIGPWGIPNAVTDRAWISVSSAADQFSACLANLTQIIRDCGVDAPWVDPEAENVLNQCKIIWLHLNDIGDFQAIATRWGERFGTVDFHTHEWRTLQPGEDGPIMGGRYVHPIVGGAKVEIDVLLAADDIYAPTQKIANQYFPVELTRTPTGWTAAQSSETPLPVVPEETTEAISSQVIVQTNGILAFAHYLDEDWVGGGIHETLWLGRLRYGLDFLGPAIYWPTIYVYERREWPENIYAHARKTMMLATEVYLNLYISGFDAFGQLTGFNVVDRYPDETVVVEISSIAYGLYAQFRPPPTFQGLAWFDYTVTGPSGTSRPQRFCVEVL